MKIMRSWMLFLAVSLTHPLWAFQLDPLGTGNRKIILTGWEFAYMLPENFLDNAEALDRTPADGIVVSVMKSAAAGRNFDSESIMTAPVWRDELLEDVVLEFREMARHRSMRHSFIKGMHAPTGVRLDWRDDNAWAIVSNNLAVVARLARKVGFPGIHMDVEDYWRKRQFFRIPADPPTLELGKIVRKRGQQVFSAVFKAYPDITIFSYFGMSASFFLRQDREAVSQARAYRDLLPYFINGMLDVMPPSARFMEGTENAYRFDYAKKDFLTAKTQIYNWYLPLVEPENRAKYLSQVITGFGLYMDAYVFPKEKFWHIGAIDGSRLEYLRRNAAQALSATDEYVWFWGERGMWIDWDEKALARVPRKARTGRWDDLIPGGLSECLPLLKDPEKYLLPRIEKAIASGAVTNMISNPACRLENAGEPGIKPDVAPAPFTCWQHEPRKGDVRGVIGTDTSTGDGDSSSLYIKGTHAGRHLFPLANLRPGTHFYVKARVKGDGAFPTLNFKRGKDWLVDHRNYLAIEGDDPDEWRTIRACVRVPEGADGAALLLGVLDVMKDEVVRYDNIYLYELPDSLVTGVEKQCRE